MPFSLSDFLDYAAGYLVAHPVAFGLWFCGVVIVIAQLTYLALSADVARRRKQEADAYRRQAAALKQAQIQIRQVPRDAA